MTRMYRQMKLIRRFEETVSDAFSAGKIPGFIHLCIGQEATAVGACEALRVDDFITSTHRGHGHVIAKGASTNRVMAELFGKSTGYCKGKGGSMHVADFQRGILGANGVVGAGLPIGIGAGVSSIIRKSGQVTVCFFGEGATSSGYFHEAINMASLLKLPVVFFCENNHYAEFTPITKHVPVDRVADRACAYGVPGETIDGNDVVEVYETMAMHVNNIREGSGPVLIEALTYRWHGHYEGDRADYRSHKELQEWMSERDPIQILMQRMSSLVPDTELKKIDESVESEIHEAVDFAERSPLPEPDHMLQDVYAE